MSSFRHIQYPNKDFNYPSGVVLPDKFLFLKNDTVLDKPYRKVYVYGNGVRSLTLSNDQPLPFSISMIRGTLVIITHPAYNGAVQFSSIAMNTYSKEGIISHIGGSLVQSSVHYLSYTAKEYFKVVDFHIVTSVEESDSFVSKYGFPLQNENPRMFPILYVVAEGYSDDTFWEPSVEVWINKESSTTKQSISLVDFQSTHLGNNIQLYKGLRVNGDVLDVSVYEESMLLDVKSKRFVKVGGVYKQSNLWNN